jgi:hypothetical protein
LEHDLAVDLGGLLIELELGLLGEADGLRVQGVLPVLICFTNSSTPSL